MRTVFSAMSRLVAISRLLQPAEISFQFCVELHSIVAVVGFAYDDEVGFVAQNGAQCYACHEMIFHEHDANLGRSHLAPACSGTGTSTKTCVPAPRAERTCNSPP